MTLSIQELEKMKQELEDAKTAHAEAQGRMKELKARLKKEYKRSSVKQLLNLAAGLTMEVKQLREKEKKQEREVQRLWHDNME